MILKKKKKNIKTDYLNAFRFLLKRIEEFTLENYIITPLATEKKVSLSNCVVYKNKAKNIGEKNINSLIWSTKINFEIIFFS